MSPKPMTYFAYLVRVWREEGTRQWRATVEDPHSSERRSFSDLGQLFAFLRERTQQADARASDVSNMSEV